MERDSFSEATLQRLLRQAMAAPHWAPYRAPYERRVPTEPRGPIPARPHRAPDQCTVAEEKHERQTPALPQRNNAPELQFSETHAQF